MSSYPPAERKPIQPLRIVIAATVLIWAGAAAAQATPSADSHASHHGAQSPSADGYTEGEIRKIDKEAGKITLKHGAIANLGMPPMSMVFHTKDPAVLDKLSTGEKVRFKAERIDGALTVTEIEAMR